MLLANNIYFSRNNKEILNNINISLSPKKIIHLSGDNGIGKTTLLKILCNVLEPEKGDIFWKSKNIKKNPFEFYKDLTFIMDKEISNINLTLTENIFFWKNLFSSKIKNIEIDSVLDLLSLKKYKNTPVNYLSNGERKKLELLRLIIEQKKLWVLDEPFLGLDQSSIDIINQTIIKHLDLNGMVIMTSHLLPAIPNIENFNLNNNAQY
tara:strand:+ start:1350 stop:1973 length:624 start_codon:yes stop_codon:yes gene_type:complete